MKNKSKFCPKCGSEEGPFVKGFCKKCYLHDHEVVSVPAAIKLEKCNRCGKVMLHGKWTDPKIKELLELVSKKVKTKELTNVKIAGEIMFHSDRKTVAHLKINGKINSTVMETEKEVLLDFRSTICDPCMRLTSNYHEAILQIRSAREIKGNKKNEILREVELFLSKERKKDPLAEVVAVKTSKTGFDLLIGSKKAGKRAAEMLAQKYKSNVKTSYKVVGRDKRKGKERKRFTFCVRI